MVSFRKALAKVALYAAIMLVTALLVEMTSIALGLFPPRYELGDPVLGWRSASASDTMNLGRCTEFSTGEVHVFPRNEDGVRTSFARAQLMEDSSDVKIAVSGDSQTDLCAPNELVHSGFLGSALEAGGVPNRILLFASGRYSPLQAYLAFREVLRPYRPTVFVLNLYTGNDLNDLLRSDDRPHFIRSDSGYRIAGPTWYRLYDPSVRHWSRIAYLARSLGDAAGVRTAIARVAALAEIAALQGKGLPAVASYLVDVVHARDERIGYPDAFTAQMLNQQLMFYHFPETVHESLARLTALLRIARSENPDIVLVMSPIPSYQLATSVGPTSELGFVTSHLPLTIAQGRAQEERLYEEVRTISIGAGWMFVDNLAALRKVNGEDGLYNEFDYHLLPPASKIIGSAEATALRDTLVALRAARGLAHGR